MFGFGCCVQRDAASARTMEDAPVLLGPMKDAVHGVRTTVDDAVHASQALQILKRGNERFVAGRSTHGATTEQAWRQALSTHGQSPLATVVGCADSRCPVEIIFDAKPGDIFVLRNAGNTCTHSEGSMVGSVEYSVQHLRTKLILVLGHTKCGAIAGATKTMLASKDSTCQPCASVLDVLLSDLVPVAKQAEDELPIDASFEEIAAHAVKVNVFHTMERLLEYSTIVRDMVRSGEVRLHGGIYNLDTGAVEFLGRLPRQNLLLGSRSSLAARPRDDVMKKMSSDTSTAVASTEKGSDTTGKDSDSSSAASTGS